MNNSRSDTKHSPTRRKILGWGGAGAMAAAAGYLGWPKPTVVGSGNGESQSTKPGVARDSGSADGALPGVLEGRNAFLPHVKSKFRIGTAESSHAAVCLLVEVGDEFAMEGHMGRFLSYSLLFEAPKEFVAESRMYRLSHPQMGDMEMFLSPVGKSDESVHLEAVCSRKV